MKATLKVGKEGINSAFLAALDDAPKHHELVKLKFEDFKEQKKELTPQLAEKCGGHFGYVRAALERMMRIYQMIQDGEHPNCTRMSVDFEVSVRTLKRDIKFMRERLEMPIEFEVLKNGFSFTRPAPHFRRRRRWWGFSWRRGRLRSTRGRPCSRCWIRRFGR